MSNLNNTLCAFNLRRHIAVLVNKHQGLACRHCNISAAYLAKVSHTCNLTVYNSYPAVRQCAVKLNCLVFAAVIKQHYNIFPVGIIIVGIYHLNKTFTVAVRACNIVKLSSCSYRSKVISELKHTLVVRNKIAVFNCSAPVKLVNIYRR